MSSLLDKVATAMGNINPDAPVTEILGAAAHTAANPSPINIITDIELAFHLVTEFKAAVKGMHPSVQNLIKLLF